MDLYNTMVFLHVALLVYWLGPDFGVYVASDYVSRKGTPVEERVRFLTAIIRMAQVSRNCLILLFGVGLWLAADLGASTLTGLPLYASLAAVVLWFALSVYMYPIQGTALGRTLNQIDQWIRYGLIVLLPLIAVLSFMGQGPFEFNWVALKVLLFALLLINSIQQRAVAVHWKGALAQMKDDPNSAEAQAVFDRTLPRARLNAYLTWTITLSIAFLGVTKPF